MKDFENLKKAIDNLRLAEFREIKADIIKKLSKYPNSYGVIVTILDGLEKEYENPR